MRLTGLTSIDHNEILCDRLLLGVMSGPSNTSATLPHPRSAISDNVPGAHQRCAERSGGIKARALRQGINVGGSGESELILRI